MKGVFVIVAIIGILIAAGVIVGGAIMCWRSTTYHVCSDWQYHGHYYALYSCGTVYTDPIAPTVCNTTDLCYCRSPTYDYTCIPKPPTGVSPTLLTGGIIMIVVGVVFIGIAIFMMCMAMND
jgi:hypothetical protein